VSTLAGVSSVFVIADNVIRQQSVTLGAHEGTLNEIVDGLQGNEILAISNLNQLVTGTKVKIATAEANGAPPQTEARKPEGVNGEGKRGRPREGIEMKLADVSIRRPVFAFMMSLAMVTIGVFSYKDLGVDLMPRTDLPTVNINVNLPGASAEESSPS
jgi:hypothetical protein